MNKVQDNASRELGLDLGCNWAISANWPVLASFACAGCIALIEASNEKVSNSKVVED